MFEWFKVRKKRRTIVEVLSALFCRKVTRQGNVEVAQQ